jgi:energy-coupling factor transporter ATP-binding protein EcfA2
MQESKPEAILDVQGVGYSYDRALSVLNGCSCVVHNGDQIMLQGSSGGGKSTFAAILAGLRPAEPQVIIFTTAQLFIEKPCLQGRCAPHDRRRRDDCGTFVQQAVDGRSGRQARRI